jgi:glycosyl transferase family 25
MKQAQFGHPLEFFDRVYVINLKSRPDRRRQMEGEFAAVGFSSGNLEWFDAIKPDSRGPFETVGARGCFLSHVGVFAAASRHKLKRFLILEDDCDFVDEFTLRMRTIVQQLRATRWDVFYGGGSVDARVPLTGELARVEPATPIGCAHFVAFQGTHAIRRVADYLAAQLARPGGDPAGGPMHVDGSYCWARRDLLLETVIANPDVCHQRSSRRTLLVPGGGTVRPASAKPPEW